MFQIIMHILMLDKDDSRKYKVHFYEMILFIEGKKVIQTYLPPCEKKKLWRNFCQLVFAELFQFNHIEGFSSMSGLFNFMSKCVSRI